jgi:hypothetical protein
LFSFSSLQESFLSIILTGDNIVSSFMIYMPFHIRLLREIKFQT